MNTTLSRIRRGVRIAALALAIGAAGYAAVDAHAAEAPAPAHAATAGHGIAVQVVGSGTPVLFIPGLNSGADTWRDTCAALQASHVQCHLVQLPGFAGQPAVASKAYLDEMSRGLLDYIRDRHLAHPVVVGHSLGGIVALKMAIAQPKAIGKLAIIDALPFLPAVQNPAATGAGMQPVAAGVREQLLKADDAAYRAQAEAAARGMVHDAARVAEVARWSAASDRATTAQAMYEMMTTDLRPALGAIRAPTLVLGSWAGYAPYGATKASTTQVFQGQYAKLAGVHIALSEAGYHFLMWDDAKWLQSQLRGFIVDGAAAAH
ncbi:alpha/beta hydrolase [Frateuria sp. Soil773]|uniref:alpha/beta fold hydrolase n=1 Tax=Frateuria sp. Soil773 TaxID=1736407 RepID=UPI0006F5DF2E|nr:alpha/beta hydrolase [Frateuria sp. Soil773]KRE88829.1 alpha/beta hydrolase [Frateuria sp. Soil773]